MRADTQMPTVHAATASARLRPAYDLVVWDFDGTLADSLHAGLKLFNEMAGKYRFKPIVDTEATRRYTTLAFIRAHKIPLLKVPFLIREFLKRQRANMPAIPLYPGIDKLVGELHGIGCPMGVVSSNTPENIHACLEANGIDGRFSFVSGCGSLMGKTRAIKKAVKKHLRPQGRVLYIGDEVRDIVSARKAGVRVASVTWGFHCEELLRNQKPDYCVADCDQLRRVLVV